MSINKAFVKLHDYFSTLDIDRIQAELSIPPPCTLSISSLIEWFRESKVCTDPYPECFKLLSIYLCIPVTTATCERTFSTLRTLNNFLRSKEHLNALLAELHPSILEDISPNFIATQFVSFNNERKIYYGHFI